MGILRRNPTCAQRYPHPMGKIGPSRLCTLGLEVARRANSCADQARFGILSRKRSLPSQPGVAGISKPNVKRLGDKARLICMKREG